MFHKLLILYILLVYGVPPAYRVDSILAGVQIRLTGITEISFKNTQGSITKRSKKLEAEVIAIIENSVFEDKIVMAYCSHTCVYLTFVHASDVLIDSYNQEYKVIRGHFSVQEDYPFLSNYPGKKLRINYYDTKIAEFSVNPYDLIEKRYVQLFDTDSTKKRKALSIMYDYNAKIPLNPLIVEKKEFKNLSNSTSTGQESSRLEVVMRNLNIH